MIAHSILEPGVKARSRAGTINNPKKEVLNEFENSLGFQYKIVFYIFIIFKK
jgi:hypothetical protein